VTEGAAEVVLRPIVPDDLDRLSALEVELFGAGAWSTTMLADELAGPGRWYVGAVRGGAAGQDLIGYAGIWDDGDDVQVMTIGVAREAQGHGVGGMLLGALLEHARQVGAGSAFLEVRVDNVPALALYERFGFERIGRRRRYYQPEDVDAWTMRLELTGAGAPDEGNGR
jgi:[ribosomal protein S18]-alanine N-acetyltransferase